MALKLKELEALWPEGPVFTYRAAADQLAAGSGCGELRQAAQELLRLEAAHVEVNRLAKGIDPTSWLMVTREVARFACIALEGVRSAGGTAHT